MIVGILTVRLRLPENHSLKGKRQVVKSVIQRVRNRFNVSVAEVEDQDLWQLATIGVACVSNSAAHVNEVLCKVQDFIAGSRLDAELLDYEIEILP
ncbi:MAG TPA: DUF503 domain-containing protein [Dehalococcoidia bacterium]|nr:DUF503 domain-containing protein [Dehalococcoidia bacterium]